MNLKNYILSTSFVFLFFNLFSQEIETYFENQKTVPFQKIYLHTDRDFYFKGDTLWFAAYLVDGKLNKPINENCNLYLNLLNAKGKTIKNKMFPIANGFGSGYLSFSDSIINEGNYMLRAYTDYLLNFGNEVFYTKPIKITTVKNSFEINSNNINSELSNKTEVSFLPEGGFLLSNKINRVAFKAINEFGKATDINGKLLDEKGNFIASFKTNYMGMGSFYFIPEKNKNYKVKIENYPNLNIQFPETREFGSKLMLGKISNNFLNLNIVSNQQQKTPFYIAVFHGGKKLFYLEIANYEKLKTIRIKTKHLKNGINLIVLLNNDYEPISERLVFIEKNEDVPLEIQLNKDEFKTRDLVQAQIKYPVLNEEKTHLSITVINENLLNSNGISQNIKSYLLLDSELKGPIENPAHFFIENDEISIQEKLNLLMLTNGWRNYIWNNLKKDSCEIKYWPQFGNKIAGSVKNKDKFLSNTEVTLSISSSNKTELFSTQTNLIGNFYFNNTLVYDTAFFFIQSNNYKQGWNTQIEIDKPDVKIPDVNAEALKQISDFTDIPISMYRLYYYNQLNLKEFKPDADTKMLKQIDVKAKKSLTDGHFRMYSSPNYSLKIDERDHNYSNMFQYLAARVPGVKVWGNRIKIRQAPAFTRAANMGFHKDHGDEPLYLLDGFMVDGKTLSFISVADIDKIEILKGAVAGIFGGLGEYGVVSVLTKKSGDYISEPAEIPGTVYNKIMGFSKCREFYSPKYTEENRNSPLPDYRTTLFWSPNITMQNGFAEVSFFTCDNLSRYKIFVEGISENGKICLGTAAFEVNATNTK